MKTSLLAVLSVGALASGAVLTGSPGAVAATPTPTVVSFGSDTPGGKANGYASPDSPVMQFYDTSGANLQINDYGGQSHGQGLAVFADDASALEIRFTAPTTGLSLAFGNDDSSFTDATDQAQLTLYRNAVQVGQKAVNFNANDIMDQTISFSGEPFNRATFQYVDASGTPINLIEVVDDIAVNPLCTITGDSGNNTLDGTSGDDVICGGDGDDVIKGRGGNDLIYPGAGDDTTVAGGGDDTVIDSAGDDRIRGGGGDDDVRGAVGADNVKGGGGKDRVNGGPGKDRLNGGPGKDRCDGGLGKDTGVRCETRIRIP